MCCAVSSLGLLRFDHQATLFLIGAYIPFTPKGRKTAARRGAIWAISARHNAHERGEKDMASRATLRDDEYITWRKTKTAALLYNLRSPNTTERAAASRLGVGVHQCLDWEQGRAVPPHSKRGVLANCVYDWADERFKRSDFVRTWSGLAGVWGWPGLAEAEWDYYDRAGRLVDRPELRDLISDWNSVVETSTPRVRFVDGDHGSGKSTLVHSLLTQVAHGSSDVVAASSSCPELSQGHGYGPLKELVSEMVQQLVGPRMRERGLTLGDLLWKAPAWRDSILEGFEAAARPWAENQKTSRSTIFPDREKHPQFLDLIRMAKSPLLFFIDNLQWADPSTLSLLLSFIKATSSGKYPIYLVAALRHFEAHQAGAPYDDFRLFFRESLKESNVRLLRLGDGIDVGEYLAKRYGGYELPIDVTRLAEMATRGNPYQLETLFDELDRLGSPQRLPQDQFQRLMQEWLNTLRRLLSGTSQESDPDAALDAAFQELRGKIGDVILKMRLDQMD
jgi:hypothetical protein